MNQLTPPPRRPAATREPAAPRYSTVSDMEVEPLYTPEDLDGWRYDAHLGAPGEYPYTRGVYPSMYRGRLWTMRQFAGFGTAEDTNERFKFLLAPGADRALDRLRHAHPHGLRRRPPARAAARSAARASRSRRLADMEALFDGIPLDRRHHLDDRQLHARA